MLPLLPPRSEDTCFHTENMSMGLWTLPAFGSQELTAAAAVKPGG